MQMIWSAAQGDASPPTPPTTTSSAPPPSPPQSLHLSLPFSPSASGEMLSALPAAFVQKVIYFSCCSPACYFSLCRIGWRGRGWVSGGRWIRRWGFRVGEPVASPVQMNNCHLLFAGHRLAEVISFFCERTDRDAHGGKGDGNPNVVERNTYLCSHSVSVRPAT